MQTTGKSKMQRKQDKGQTSANQADKPKQDSKNSNPKECEFQEDGQFMRMQVDEGDAESYANSSDEEIENDEELQIDQEVSFRHSASRSRFRSRSKTKSLRSRSQTPGNETSD